MAGVPRIPRRATLALALLLSGCGAAPDDAGSSAELAIESHLVRVAADTLGMSLQPDSTLRSAARDLALLIAGGFAGDVQEALRQATSEQCALDPVPYLVYGTSDAEWPAELLRRFQAGLAAMPARERRLCTHVAVGIAAHRQRRGLLPSRRVWSVMLLVSQRALAYQRFPVAGQPGDRFLFEGEIFAPFRTPQILLTDPSGRVRRLENLAPERTTFRTYVHFDAGAGEYQLEVLGQDDMGPRVLGLGALHARAEGTPSPHAERLAAARRGESAPGGTPALGSARRATDASQEESRMAALVNRDRRRAGVPPLQLDPQLAALARSHSRDMLEHGFFAHVSPRTGPLGERAAAAGIAFRRIAENLALHRDVEGAEQALLRSPGHRANILDPEFTHLGIGVVLGHEVDGAPRVYVTQNFLVRSTAMSAAQSP